MVDIDETICFYPNKYSLKDSKDYLKAIPNYENINKINSLYDLGNTIIYWTARGSRSGKNWYDLTKQQLINWGAKFNDLKCDKPYYDLFIEDRSIRIEEL
jgi:hypothetical protein